MNDVNVNGVRERLPAAPHSGQVREARGSLAAWPDPRFADLFPKEQPTLWPFALAFQVPLG